MKISIVEINLRKKENVRTKNLSIQTSMSGARKNDYIIKRSKCKMFNVLVLNS